MDQDTGRQVISAAFRSGAELQGLLGLLKEQCTAEEYKFYRRQIATALDDINVALIKPVLARYPELSAEIESNLARTGQALP